MESSWMTLLQGQLEVLRVQFEGTAEELAALDLRLHSSHGCLGHHRLLLLRGGEKRRPTRFRVGHHLHPIRPRKFLHPSSAGVRSQLTSPLAGQYVCGDAMAAVARVGHLQEELHPRRDRVHNPVTHQQAVACLDQLRRFATVRVL